MRMNKILSLCCPHQFRQYKNNHQSVSRLKFVIACSEKHYIMIRELTYRFGARFRPNLKRNILSRWWYASQWFAARGKVDQSFSSVGYYALAKAFGSGTLLHYYHMRALALNHEWEIALTVLMKLEPNNILSQERGESWFFKILLTFSDTFTKHKKKDILWAHLKTVLWSDLGDVVGLAQRRPMTSA